MYACSCAFYPFLLLHIFSFLLYSFCLLGTQGDKMILEAKGPLFHGFFIPHICFLHLSSGYSYSICLYTNLHQPYTRTPHTRTQTNLQLHRSLDRVLCEITSSIHGSVGDGRVTFLCGSTRERQQNFIGANPGVKRKCDS